MQETRSRASSLRVGHFTFGSEDRTEWRPGCCTQATASGVSNPCELEALLAVTDVGGGESGVLSARTVLAALQECLQRGPSREEDLPCRVLELLGRLDEHLRGSQSGASAPFEWRPNLTLVLIQSGRYVAVREGASPALLFRKQILKPIGAECGGRRDANLGGAGGERLIGVRSLASTPGYSPHVLSGPLEDGDVVIVASADLQLILGDREIRLSLLQSGAPGDAAQRLAEATRERGQASTAVGVLYVGSGPTLAARVRSPTVLPGDTPRIASSPPTAAPPPRADLIAGTAVLGGALLGTLFGVWLTLSLGRPANIVPPATTSLPTPDALRVEVQPTAPLPLPVHIQPAGSAPLTKTHPRALPPTTSVAAPGAPHTFPSVTTAATSAPPQRPDNVLPPLHTLAQGMTPTVCLHARLDPVASALRLSVNQGRLVTLDAPEGIPAGEPLIIALCEQPSPRDLQERTELRLLTDEDQLVAAIRSRDYERLLAGATVSFWDLAPGDYRLVWWSPTRFSRLPTTTLRIVGP